MKTMMTGLTRYVVLVTMLLLGALLQGCESQDMAGPAAANVPTFRILAGSELKDIAPQIDAFSKANGVKVTMEYTGSLDAVDRLSEPHQFDAVWLSHGKYLQLVPSIKDQVKASEKTMFSRVVLGVKPETAKALGWKSGKVSWKDVLAASKAGKFHFAMTNPAGSNSGFVTLVGVASELSGKGDALQAEDIPQGKLKEFFSGMSLTSGSSGDLVDKYKANVNKADGIINYESLIVGMNASGTPLDVIVPKEGVITADYPLMLLTGSKQADTYNKLVAFMRDDNTQKWLAENTHRTPLKGSGTDEVVNELPFPGTVKVVDAILRGFLDSYSKASSSYFVLDVSGSMAGPRMADIKASMNSLTHGGDSTSGRFSTFRNREVVGVTAFSNAVHDTEVFELKEDPAANEKTMQAISGLINGLGAEGGTAIYSALMQVYPQAQAALKAGDRSVSIVLFTDGENNNGASLEQYIQFVQNQGEPHVPVYGILYGEANVSDMQQMVDASKGKLFDARKQSLKQVLKTIRAYQ